MGYSRQERFRNITSQFYKDADGLVLIYDVTDKFSFERLNKWIEQIISSIGSNEISMVLLGNKCEMEVRTVTKEMGNQLAEKYKINYFETSYKTGQGINEAFYSLAREIMYKKGIGKINNFNKENFTKFSKDTKIRVINKKKKIKDNNYSLKILSKYLNY